MKVSSNPDFLKGFFTTEVYSINSPSSPILVEESDPMVVSFTGDGSSGVAVFISSDPQTAEKDLLEKVLSSIHLSLSNIALFTNVPPMVNDVLEKHNLKKVITFGVPASLNKSITHISSVTLSELLSQVSHKKELWSLLKASF
jgi:DNA polymerase III psi subunit